MAERRANPSEREKHAPSEREKHAQGQRHDSSRSGSSKQHRESGQGSERRDESADLKQREYRDKEGNVHHHTHEYMERHGNKGGSGSDRS